MHLGRGKHNKEEEELSSLSGFTASDREEEEEEEHDDHNEIKWSMAPKNKKNKYAESEEEEEEEEDRDIMLKPQDDLHERFREHDMMRRKGEQEKQEQKLLAARNAEMLHNAQNSQTMPLKVTEYEGKCY